MKNRVPSVGANVELRVIQSFAVCRVLLFDFEALSGQEILLECCFFLIREHSENLGFVPVDGAFRAMTSMFGDAGNVGVELVGRDVISVLLHTSPERNTCHADVSAFSVAGADLFINSLEIEWVGTSSVRSAENLTEFGTWP